MTARVNLDMIHDKLNQRLADARARAVDRPTIDGDASPGNERLTKAEPLIQCNRQQSAHLKDIALTTGELRQG